MPPSNSINHPPFDEHSTADDVLDRIDLTGKRVLVTGVSAGLGVETARTLITHGADVIGAVRDVSKAQAVTSDLRNGNIKGQVELVECDLASLKSVRSCADELVAAGKQIDVVIANAGVMACPQGKTADGFETQFGTNHLGHFVLINRLLPLLESGARVVVLASAGHRHSDIDLADLHFEHTPYDPFVAYGRAKTANILFAVEFDRRNRANGVRATAVHPGVIETELGRHMTEEVREKALAAFRQQFGQKAAIHMKTIAQGAATSVWAGFVADAAQVGGRYCEDCGVADVAAVDLGERRGVRPYAVDPERAKALWEKSEELVGEHLRAGSQPSPFVRWTGGAQAQET